MRHYAIFLIRRLNYLLWPHTAPTLHLPKITYFKGCFKNVFSFAFATQSDWVGERLSLKPVNAHKQNTLWRSMLIILKQQSCQINHSFRTVCVLCNMNTTLYWQKRTKNPSWLYFLTDHPKAAGHVNWLKSKWCLLILGSFQMHCTSTSITSQTRSGTTVQSPNRERRSVWVCG